jgi:hypothetical protein
MGEHINDLNVQVRVRNNQILSRIRKRFNSVADMCRMFDMAAQRVNSFICFRETPFREDGTLRETAEKLCSVLGVTPDDLWPNEMAKIKQERSTYELELSTAEAMAICHNPDRKFVQLQLISRWAHRLNDREKLVINERFSGSTLDDVAKMIGTHRERARQIEAKALRKLKIAAKVMDGIETYTQVIE